MKVNFLDLAAQHAPLKAEFLEAFSNIIDKSAFALGYAVEEFEENWADYCNRRYAVAVNSGTSALHLALIAAGIGAGHEVILPPNTFIATAWAVSYVGAKPVFADIDLHSYNINPEEVVRKITVKTKAIIAVDLYGLCADYSILEQISKDLDIKLIEDASQSHGAKQKGRKAGSFGHISTFSFYPGKNLGALGEGGAIVTNSEEMANRMKKLRNHAQPARYLHEELGFNHRMDGMQGAALNIKLKYLNQWNAKRAEIAKIYDENLSNLAKLQIPFIPENNLSAYHQYEIRLQNEEQRNALANFLNENEIQTGLHYPVPIHLQKAYKNLGYQVGDFPNAELTAQTLLSLPIHPTMTADQAEFVCEKIAEYVG